MSIFKKKKKFDFHTGMKIKKTKGEQIGQVLIIIFLGLFGFACLYPFWHVLMYSISNSKAASTGGFFLFPRDVTFFSYKMIFKTTQIFIAYKNTILKTLCGTVLSLILTSLTAYPLSVRRFRGRNFFSLLIFFTMLFSGGMIPTFLIVKDLGLIDTFWALILPGAMSAYNMFILRNYMQSLPASLEESAHIDGANAFTTLFRIILPLCTPSLAALAMFYGVHNWNSYMDCLLYTNTNSMQVLQLYLRSVLAQSSAMNALSAADTATIGTAAAELSDETMKMTIVGVSVVPVLLVYPFLQRFYTKGITVGAVKG